MNLSRLGEPFDPSDIEWRVSRAGMGKKGVYCNVLAYITARAIQRRLDEVCGPENWRNEAPIIHMLPGDTVMVVGGISIRLGDEWVTKWDVSETTNVEPVKGGFSGAMKRAGAQWGIGRYLYLLEEKFAEVSDVGGPGWNYAKLPKDQGGAPYYWKDPTLPAWAVPRELEHEISLEELNELKRLWKARFAPESTNPKELREGFGRFVASVCGEFPAGDLSCWLRESWEKCMKRIADTTDPDGPDSDVPFGD